MVLCKKCRRLLLLYPSDLAVPGIYLDVLPHMRKKPLPERPRVAPPSVFGDYDGIAVDVGISLYPFPFFLAPGARFFCRYGVHLDREYYRMRLFYDDDSAPCVVLYRVRKPVFRQERSYFLCKRSHRYIFAKIPIPAGLLLFLWH